MKETPVSVIGPFALDSIFVALKEKDGQRVCVLDIGLFEALAISLGLTNYPVPRPMTHDLIINLLRKLGDSIDRAVITKFEREIYYAVIYLKHFGSDCLIEIDSRPSDAIALAVREKCPIFVNDDLLKLDNDFNQFLREIEKQTVGMIGVRAQEQMSDEEAKRFLESLDSDKLHKA